MNMYLLQINEMHYIISKYIKIKHKTICVREEKHMVKYKTFIYIYTYLHGPRASLIGFKHAPEFSLQPAACYIYILLEK